MITGESPPVSAPPPAAPPVKRPYKRKTSNQPTWATPVMLPSSTVPAAAVPPEKANKKGFQWKTPTRGWHNGLPPGTAAPSASATSHPQANAPSYTRASNGQQSSYMGGLNPFAGRSCTTNIFSGFEDTLCGFQLCTSREPGVNRRPTPPSYQQAGHGDGGLVYVEARTPANGYHNVTDSDTMLVEELLQAEAEEKGGLWKLVTDLFTSPAPMPAAPPAPTQQMTMYPEAIRASNGCNGAAPQNSAHAFDAEMSMALGANHMAPSHPPSVGHVLNGNGLSLHTFQSGLPTNAAPQTASSGPLAGMDDALEPDDMLSLYEDVLKEMPGPPMHDAIHVTEEPRLATYDMDELMDANEVASEFSDSKRAAAPPTLPLPSEWT